MKQQEVVFMFPPYFQDTDSNCSCVKCHRAKPQDRSVAGYQTQPPAHKVMGDYRPLQWGHGKLSQQCWIQTSVFPVDKVSQESSQGLSYFQNLTFSKYLLDDSSCLASTVTCYYSSILCTGWVRKAFSTLPFPLFWTNRKISSWVQGGRLWDTQSHRSSYSHCYS